MKLNFPSDEISAIGDLVYQPNHQGTAIREGVRPLNPRPFPSKPPLPVSLPSV